MKCFVLLLPCSASTPAFLLSGIVPRTECLPAPHPPPTLHLLFCYVPPAHRSPVSHSPPSTPKRKSLAGSIAGMLASVASVVSPKGVASVFRPGGLSRSEGEEPEEVGFPFYLITHFGLSPIRGWPICSAGEGGADLREKSQKR